MKRPILMTSLACAWMALVIALSFLPFRYKVLLHTKGRFHLLGHVFVFATAGLLLSASAISSRARATLLLCTFSFAWLVEYVQHVRYASPIEWSDILADAVGAASIVTVAMYKRVLNKT